jgi:hypothetical protein
VLTTAIDYFFDMLMMTIYQLRRNLVSRLILLTFLLASFAGHSFAQTKSYAEAENERINGRLIYANNKFNSCNNDIKNSAIAIRMRETILVDNDSSANKFSLLMNKNKLSTEQFEFVKDALPILSKCRQVVIEEQDNTPFQIVTLKYYNSMDEIYLKLLKGEITIGEANEAKLKALSQHKIDWTNVSNELQASLRTRHDSEMAEKRQAAATLQQQQFQRQMMYQQQMQNVFNNRPPITPTVTTNCTTLGNQINCTSR